jgi:hypothetical protein
LQTPLFRLLLQSDIPVALTTDGYRASSYHPWTAISWAVTGRSVSGSEVLGSGNRLSRGEALRLFTLGAAWFESNEHEKGRIAPGNLADFAVLSADYFAVPDEEIRHVSSVLTVVDGRIVFGARRIWAPGSPAVASNACMVPPQIFRRVFRRFLTTGFSGGGAAGGRGCAVDATVRGSVTAEPAAVHGSIPPGIYVTPPTNVGSDILYFPRRWDRKPRR